MSRHFLPPVLPSIHPIWGPDEKAELVSDTDLQIRRYLKKIDDFFGSRVSLIDTLDLTYSMNIFTNTNLNTKLLYRVCQSPSRIELEKRGWKISWHCPFTLNMFTPHGYIIFELFHPVLWIRNDFVTDPDPAIKFSEFRIRIRILLYFFIFEIKKRKFLILKVKQEGESINWYHYLPCSLK